MEVQRLKDRQHLKRCMQFAKRTLLHEKFQEEKGRINVNLMSKYPQLSPRKKSTSNSGDLCSFHSLTQKIDESVQKPKKKKKKQKKKLLALQFEQLF